MLRLGVLEEGLITPLIITIFREKKAVIILRDAGILVASFQS